MDLYILLLCELLFGVTNSVQTYARLNVISMKINWFIARSQCTLNHGRLVSKGFDFSCQSLEQPFPKKLWLEGHKVPSWIRIEGCFDMENLSYLRTLSIEDCLSHCKTNTIGFIKKILVCFCLNQMPSKKLQDIVCAYSLDEPRFASVYTVTDIQVDFHEQLHNSSCLGIYVKCTSNGGTLIPADCQSIHTIVCEGILMPFCNGNMLYANHICSEKHRSIMSNYSAICERLPIGNTAWTNTRLIWHDPYEYKADIRNIHEARNCSFVECLNGESRSVFTQGSCSMLLDGYLCLIKDNYANKTQALPPSFLSYVPTTQKVTSDIRETHSNSLDTFKSNKKNSSSQGSVIGVPVSIGGLCLIGAVIYIIRRKNWLAPHVDRPIPNYKCDAPETNSEEQDHQYETIDNLQKPTFVTNENVCFKDNRHEGNELVQEAHYSV